MSDDDNRFANVAETLETADEDGETDSSPEAVHDLSDAQDRDPDQSADADVPDDPAFPFRDVTQYPFYARRESWVELEAAIESSLRERGIADVRDRELHDAVLRVAAADPDAVAETIAEARTDGVTEETDQS